MGPLTYGYKLQRYRYQTELEQCFIDPITEGEENKNLLFQIKHRG